MAQASGDHNLRNGNGGLDRRRSGALARIERWTIAAVRSRWIAMFVVSFAVSWSFHIVDSRSERQLKHQQAIMTCTIQGVATAQDFGDRRTQVRPILEACEKQEDK